MINITATVTGHMPTIEAIAEAVVKLWHTMHDDVDEWTRTDDILNECMIAVVTVGTAEYGPETFGWALVDAGLTQDDAETCVDRTLGTRPQKPDVYEEYKDIWEDEHGYNADIAQSVERHSR